MANHLPFFIMADELLAPPKPPNPLIGREAELKWLADESNRRERRYPDMPLVVLGEAGIGKTALVAAFVKQLPRSERAIWIQCRNFDKNEAAFHVAMRRGLAGEREVIAVLDGADEVSEEEFTQTFRGVVNFKVIRSVIITSSRCATTQTWRRGFSDTGCRNPSDAVVTRIGPDAEDYGTAGLEGAGKESNNELIVSAAISRAPGEGPCMGANSRCVRLLRISTSAS